MDLDLDSDSSEDGSSGVLCSIKINVSYNKDPASILELSESTHYDGIPPSLVVMRLRSCPRAVEVIPARVLPYIVMFH